MLEAQSGGKGSGTAQRVNAQNKSVHTPWRQETVRRDQAPPTAETGRPCQAARASQAVGRPTAARRDQPLAAATQAAAATSVGQPPVSRQRCQTLRRVCSQEQLGKHRYPPCSATGVARARLFNMRASDSDTGRARKAESRTGGGNATTGCFPCSVRP